MRYYSAPRRALRGVRQLLYPRRCPFCNAVLGSIRTCPDCAEEVDRLRRKPGIRLDASQHYLGGLSGAAAPFRYEGCVRRAILRAKYQAAPWTAVELGVVLAELAFGSEVRMRGAEPVPQRVEGARLGYDCIVPVPAQPQTRVQCTGTHGAAAGRGTGPSAENKGAWSCPPEEPAGRTAL